MSGKLQLFDPITAISNIIFLNFSPLYTKISIKNNQVSLIEHNPIQSITRLYNGDSRNDLHVLNIIIEQFISCYLIPAKNKIEVSKMTNSELNDYDKIKKLAIYSCKGLKKLQESYYYLNSKQQDNASFTIQYFINTINDIINNCYEHDDKTRKPMHSQISKSSENLSVDFEMVSWTSDNIDVIYKWFSKCFDEDNNPIKNKKIINDNLDLIRVFINSMDKKFHECVKTT